MVENYNGVGIELVVDVVQWLEIYFNVIVFFG